MQLKPCALPGTTLLATPRGPVPVAEIRADDEVYALDPTQGLRVTRLLRTRPLDAEPLLRIETAGRSLCAAAAQPVLTVSGKGKRGGALAWKEASALSKGDVVVCVLGYGAEDGPQDASLARMIGAFLGMGYVEDGRAGANVGDARDSHTARYCDLFRSVFPGAGWAYGPGLVGGISCGDEAVGRAIGALGFVSALTQRRVPRWAFSLSRACKLALLAGFMDACGRMERDGVGKMIAPLSPALVGELRELAICAGLEVSAVQRKTPRDPDLSPRAFALLSASSMAALPCWNDTRQVIVTTAETPGLSADKLGGVVLPSGAFGQKVRGIEALPAVVVFDLAVEDSTHSVVAAGVVAQTG